MSKRKPQARQVFEIDGSGSGVLRVILGEKPGLVRLETTSEEGTLAEVYLDAGGWASLLGLAGKIQLGRKRRKTAKVAAPTLPGIGAEA